MADLKAGTYLPAAAEKAERIERSTTVRSLFPQ